MIVYKCKVPNVYKNIKNPRVNDITDMEVLITFLVLFDIGRIQYFFHDAKSIGKERERERTYFMLSAKLWVL